MTKKPIKKTTKPAAKKPAVAVKPAAKPAPAAAAVMVDCGGGFECGCRRRGGWFGKLLALVIVFVAGFGLCHFGCKKHMMMKRPNWSFDANGCLDTSKIKCPMMAQKAAAADLNGDGCITREEIRAWAKEQWAQERGDSDEECPLSK